MGAERVAPGLGVIRDLLDEGIRNSQTHPIGLAEFRPIISPRLRRTARRVCPDFKVPRSRGGSVVRFSSFHVRNLPRFPRRIVVRNSNMYLEVHRFGSESGGEKKIKKTG